MIQVAVAVERYGRNAFGGSTLGGQFAHQGGHVALVLAGGGFRHLMDDADVDGMATEQGYYALAAYYRFINGQTRLYDMSEVTIKANDQPVQPTDPTTPGTPATGDNQPVMLWFGSVLISGAAILLLAQKKKKVR